MSTASHSRKSSSRVNRGADYSSNQADLFQQLDRPTSPAAASDLDLGPELLGAIHTALREARSRGQGRERIVDRMNHFLPECRPVTLRQLNAWTAQSKEFHEFPARYLAALCAATECDLPLRVLANALQLELVDSRDLLVQQVGKNLIESARLKREAGRLQRSLGA